MCSDSKACPPLSSTLHVAVERFTSRLLRCHGDGLLLITLFPVEPLKDAKTLQTLLPYYPPIKFATRHINGQISSRRNHINLYRIPSEGVDILIVLKPDPQIFQIRSLTTRVSSHVPPVDRANPCSPAHQYYPIENASADFRAIATYQRHIILQSKRKGKGGASKRCREARKR